MTTHSADAISAAAAVERTVLLMRVTNWRFQATNDPAGPDTFRTNAAAVTAALEAFEKLNVPGMVSFISQVRAALTAYSQEFSVMAPALLGLVEAYDTVQHPMIAAIQADLDEAGKSVTGVVSALGTAAANMRRAAEVMTEASDAVRHEASDTAGGAGKSSADLDAVAAVEQFTASVGEISRQVAVASDVASQAVRRAEASQTNIRGLADSTARIGDVVRLIDNIAGQTNLPALNATIEVARAGDAGKGFAVVAGEVKALAAQTAKATAEIGAQIDTVRGATEDTVAAMNEISEIIRRMGHVSTAISAAVEEQSVTTSEIASSIQGVAGLTSQAAQTMGHVVEVAEQAGEASHTILDEAAENSAASENLRLEAEQFLNAVQNDTGARLRHNGAVEVGREVELDLPKAGGSVTGRMFVPGTVLSRLPSTTIQ